MTFIPRFSPLAAFAATTVALAALTAPAIGLAAPGAAPATRVDFDRDIRPILSENCFACHGFDAAQRQGGLRLDEPEGVYRALKSGKTPIVPGKPRSSEVITRIRATNALRMPPVASGKHVTPAQAALLERWVAEGAKYSPHWAFVAPRRPALPAVRRPDWAANPVDRFILARLEREGLKPSPPADRPTLIRRLSFDLRGLPPTPAEVAAFVGDREPGAWERLVDRFLASPHFGERMAVKWLDLARYADTHGYHIDSHRDMWRWRDWVIEAFNKNLPYDDFTTWQIAGDLLPNPTLDQRIATGFNRNHPINFEGGAIPEEYLNAYIVDRVSTTATAFLGLTLQCSQCHDHKYDPLTQKDFYRFYAFFNSIPEAGLDGQRGNAQPFIKAPLPGQMEELAAQDRRVAELDGAVKERAAQAAAAQAEWERHARAEGPDVVSAGLVAHLPLDGDTGAATAHGNPVWSAGKFGQALLLDGATHLDLGPAPPFTAQSKFSYGAWVNPARGEAMTVVSAMADSDGFRGWDLYLSGGVVYAHLIHQWEGNAIRLNTNAPLPLNQWSHVLVTYDGSSKAGGVRIYVNGKRAPTTVTHNTLRGTLETPARLTVGRRSPGAPFRGLLDDVRVYSRELTPGEVEQIAGFGAIRDILAVAPEQRAPAQREALTRYYLETQDEPYRRLSAELAEAREKRTALDAEIPTVMVMQELPKPKDTFLLLRGQYDKPGDKVDRGVPSVLPAIPADAPPNRLGLARWLTDPANPLTGRVAVNRFWQGERPSHPELLDWLAASFTTRGSGAPRPDALGWDVKALIRLLVTSNTYKQTSSGSPALLVRDPENRLLARAPRFRLAAEFVRDQALSVSGLLSPRLGGPSVRPYQPPGLWEELAFGGDFTAQRYVQDHGEALYRRSMYTFWKRTCPPPSLQTFDAPEREFCIVRRSVTNTPLQALILMNDTTFVEASRKLAERLLTEVAASPRDRVAYAYRLVLARLPRGEETRALTALHAAQLAHYRANPEAAAKLLAVGESPRKEGLDPADLAAWTAVANAILNLDETITRG
jgi:mono/diheme cytochrome c family protein